MIEKKFTIIGGSGGMGRVFGTLFKKYGYEITLFARNKDKLIQAANQLGVKYALDLGDCVRDADIIMISTPITSTPQIIKEIIPLMKEDALIFDITSLKKKVFEVMKELSSNYPVNCLSLHPMFGPGITEMKNYVILTLKVGGTKNYEKMVTDLLSIFQEEGILVVSTTPEQHDKIMALTLAVPHMINIIYLNLLKKTSIPLSELTRSSSELDLTYA